MMANGDPMHRGDGEEAPRGDPSSVERERRHSTSTARELEPALDRATAALRSALHEACHTNIDRANTGELIRVEEVLAIANEAAKEAISVRQRLRGERRQLPREESSHAPDGSSSLSSREVRGDDGRRWRVFAVHPTIGRAVIRDAYAEGWLSFDAGDETRRLAPIPDGWHELHDAELMALCARADVSPRRRRATDTPVPPNRRRGDG